MIYLDNAATTYHKPPQVIEAVVKAMQSMGNAGRGTHDSSLDASRIIYDTRLKLAELFHVSSPAQVAFTANSTAALNTAIQGTLKSGDHVITTVLEHNSVLRPLYLMQERGVRLTIVPANEAGIIKYEELEREIRRNTRAVVCTHASNLTGNLTDLYRIGRLCREQGVLFIVDASQTAGIYPVYMKEMNIDVLCFTGHKGLLGPQGTGGLCVREGVKIRPLMVGGSGVHSYQKEHPGDMPAALEAGTLNGHGLAGLNAALDYLMQQDMERLYQREQDLMWRFYHGVSQISGVKVYGDFSTKERMPIVTLNIHDYDSADISDELFTVYGISTRPGAHCAPLMHECFHTKEQGAVRFSMSHSNTEEEIDAAVKAVKNIAMGK